MRSIFAGALVAASAASLAGCGHHGATDAGPQVSRNYPVGNFSGIEIAGSYDVSVHSGGKPAVSASGPRAMLDDAVVEVRGDKLVIHPKAGVHFRMFGSGAEGVKFDVTVPQLTSAATAGSGDIHVDGVQGDSFEGDVGGSGEITLDRIQVQALKLSVGGSGAIKAASGKVGAATYSIGGSGEIDAAGVEAQKANISVVASGDVSARVTETADVNVAGSGDVTVTGGAKCSVSKVGSGDVSCR